MKRIVLTLCVFIALATADNAAGFYVSGNWGQPLILGHADPDGGREAELHHCPE